MRICKNCGHVLQDGEEVCSACSSDLIIETDAVTEETAAAPEDVSALRDGSGAGDDAEPEAEAVQEDPGQEPEAEASEVTAAPEEESSAPDDEAAEMSEDETPEDAAQPAPQEDSAPASDDTETETEQGPAPEDGQEPEAKAETEPEEDQSDLRYVQEPILDPDRPNFSFTTVELDLGLNDESGLPSLPEQPQEESGTQEAPAEDQEPASDAALETAAEPENEKYKVVSVKVRNDEKLKSVNRQRIAVVVVSLLALASVISAVFMIVVPLIQARRQDEAAKEAAYMEFLHGEWLSETFIYSGEEFPSCEILTIGQDRTFVSEIWTSPNDRETYDPETWTVTARQTGDMAVEVATSSLRVSYTDSDGNVMVYRRYILKLDAYSLTLREYYNEKMTDYYDVVFTKKGNG